jgi:hypothetical protein
MLLTSTELISKSWDDYLKNWHNWMIFSLLMFLPSFILMLSGSFGAFLNMYVPATTFITNLIIALLALVSSVFGVWTYISLVHAALKSARNSKSDYWKDHYAATIYRIWPTIYSSFFAVVFIFLGVIFFLIPGIIISVWYIFVTYSVIADDEEGFKALAASKKLVRGRWWSVLWRSAVPALFFLVAGAVIQAIFIQAVALLPMSFMTEAMMENLITSSINSLISPLIVLVGVNLFNNLKSNPFRERPAILSHDSPAD